MDRHTPQLVHQRPLTFSERRRIAIAVLAVLTACCVGWFVRTPIEQATKAGYGQVPQDTRMSAPQSLEPVPSIPQQRNP